MEEKRITELEESIAHLTRMFDELSGVIARQDSEIALMTQRIRLLMERAGEQELAAGGTVPLADEKPPHW